MTTYPAETIRSSTTSDRPDSWVDTGSSGRTGVSWSAIFAGATAAAALTLIMLLLGAGTGLGASSPWAGEGAEAKTIGIAGVFWITFTQIASSGLGGYIAGRLRTKWSGLHTDEARFRDTAHGFLAWGVATLVTSALLMSAVGTTVSAGARAGMGIAGGVATSAVGVGTAAASRSGDDGSSGPMGYMVDSMLRKDVNAQPATPAPSSADTTGVAPAAPAAPAQSMNTNSTGELGRIVANALRTGSLSADDTKYAGQLVAQRTGLSQQDAEKRVSDSYTRAKTAIDDAQTKAMEAADAARKAAAYGALWIFISLVIGALVAAYTATLGGRARDL